MKTACYARTLRILVCMLSLSFGGNACTSRHGAEPASETMAGGAGKPANPDDPFQGQYMEATAEKLPATGEAGAVPTEGTVNASPAPANRSAVPPAAAAASAQPIPLTLPGTEPMFVNTPVVPLNGDPGFGCFKACGKRCDCAAKEEEVVKVAYGNKVCSYQKVTCNTHPFCVWHDGCYLACEQKHPGTREEFKLSRFGCYRACDRSCVDGFRPGPALPDYPAPPRTRDRNFLACSQWTVSSSHAPATGRISFSRFMGCQDN